MKTIDARGLSCPQPALMTRQVLQQMTSGTIEVLVDLVTSRDNVTRLAERSGWRVTSEEQPEVGFRLVLER